MAAGTNWHEPELYPDVPCPDFSCDLTQGELISVVDGEVTRGIEFTLDKTEPCYADYRLLCLGNDERFDVRAHWVDDTGEDQQAADVHLTRDSGFFWFFDDDNIEMVVKVLDGGSIGDGAFWVFAAGLTNVGVELTVEDTWTGAERTYINPLGTTYQPILDVHAFATCDATKSAAPAASEGDEGDEGPVERSQVAAAHAPGTITTSEKCAPGTLCLQDRFEVHAEFGGAQGPEDAVPVQLTPDSGYFWFFGADNVELVVKLLDACVDPFDRFWFFAAGLTDVDVRLRVRDTWTGAERLYENSQGTPFAPVLDVDAFATCDAQADLASVAEPKDVEVGSDANAPFLQP